MGVPRILDSREYLAHRRLGLTAGWAEREALDPTGAGLQMLLHVRMGGADMRAATGSVQLGSVAGVTMVYSPLLLKEFELQESYEPGSGGTGARSVTASLPNAIVSAASLIASGLLLAGEGEVAIGFDGGIFEERHVLLDGELVGGVSFGGLGEPVEFQLADASETAGYLVTPHVVDANRWPSAATSAVGQRYPLIFNKWSSVPALFVDNQIFVCCVAEAGIDDSAVSAVYVDGESIAAGDAVYGWAVSNATDSAGVPYVRLFFNGSATIESEDIAVDIQGSSTAWTYLHQLCEHLLLAYTSLGRRRVNFDLLGGIRAQLGSVPVKLLVNGSSESSSADALSILEDRVASSFPMICFGWVDGRYGPIVTDGRAPSRAELVEGIQLLRRASAVQESDKRDIANNFTVRFNYDSVENTFAGVATRDTSTSILCSRSAGVVGSRFAPVLDADLIYQQADAEMVVDWLVYHRAMPSYLVEYDVPTIAAMRLRLGWNVTLFLPSLGFSSGVIGTIVGRTFRRSVSTLAFRLWWAGIAGSGSGGGGASAPSVPGAGQ